MSQTMLKEKNINYQTVVIFCFVSFAVLFFLTTAYGIFLHYSPVPFMDEWDACLDFYMRVASGDNSAWWGQHNEHRLIFSRIFFWTDMSIFGGKMIFLLITNVVLALGLFVCFFLIIKTLFPLKTDKHIQYTLIGIIAVMVFSWVQHENFAWGIEIHFFAAYLFPIIAFCLLAASKIKDSVILFILAVLAGIISAGTMANGVLALPLLALLSIIMRIGRFKISCLVVLSGLIIYLYFINYQSPGHHGNVLDTFKNQPISVVIYIITYLGGPLYYLSGKYSYFIAPIGGIFIIPSSIYFTYRILNSSHTNKPILLALLALLAYVVATAFITSGGRLIFGIQQSLSGRYMTPALLAWCVLIILYANYFYKQLFSSLWKIAMLGLIPLLFLPYQLFKVFSNPDNYLFDRKVASLALELGVRDELKIKLVYPNIDHVISISNKAKEQNLSIFGDKQIRDANQLINKPVQTDAQNNCLGNLDEVTIIKADSNYALIKGWIFEETKQKVPEFLVVLNQQSIIAGYAITGRQRPDVQTAIGPQAEHSGFAGYILLKNANDNLTLVGKNPSCKLAVSRK
jgi:hypothetical protein